MKGGGRLAATAALIVALAAVLTTPVVADDGEIVWGGSVPLTGIYAQAGNLGVVGIDAYIAYLNATGGINGRPVRMEKRDSGSEPENALAIFKQIMAEEEDVVAFYGDSTEFAILSTPEVNERYQVLMIGASLATVLADPVQYPYQVLTGPTYAEMVGILLEYIAEQGGKDGAAPRVVLFHSNLEVGRDPIPAARMRAAELGVEIVAEIETEPAGIDVAPEVLKLRRAEPDYVIFQGYVTTVWPEVMKQAVQSGVDATFMGTFWAMEPLVIQQLGPLADRYMGVFPYRYYWDQEESATLRLIAQVTQAGVRADLRPAGLVHGHDPDGGDQAHAGRRQGAHRRQPQGGDRRDRGLGHRRPDRRAGDVQEQFDTGRSHLQGQLGDRAHGSGVGLDRARRLSRARRVS